MKNNFKQILLLILFTTIQGVSFAQNETDKMVFKSLEDELARNMSELSIDGKKPFYLEYVVLSSKSGYASASLGSIQTSLYVPIENKGGVSVLLGDYNYSSEVLYQPILYTMTLSEELEYNGLRRAFWLGTDDVYKKMLKQFEAKNAFLEQNPQDEATKKIPDLIKLKEATTTFIESTEFNYDREKWEANIKELSLIFKNYPSIINSNVQIHSVEQVYYKKSSEGVTIRYPQTYIAIIADASLKNVNNTVLADKFFVYATKPEQMPSMEELKKQITAFADEFNKHTNPKFITDSYSGPVMFEGDALYEIMRFNAGSEFSMIAYRDQIGAKPYPNLNNRLGQEIFDKRLTVKHYYDMKEYKGKPVYGSYAVDADGIIPAKELTLLENGIFKAKINGRFADPTTLESTGNCRFQMGTTSVNKIIAPGIMHMYATSGMTKDSKMKQTLLKAAKKQGFDYAYIVRCSQVTKWVSYVYQIDAKTGVETLIGNADAKYTQYLRDNVLAISDKEEVMNVTFRNKVLSTFIFPSSIILENIKIGVTRITKRNATAIN